MTNTPADIAPQTLPRATSYVWRLLMLVPAIVLGAYGYWRHVDVPAGGDVTAIRLTSKNDLAGQVRDAYDGVSPTTSDLYLVLARKDADPIKTKPFDDTPLGNGLTWTLASPVALDSIARVEVWDHNAVLRDKELDRTELPGDVWQADGQTFHLSFIGTKLEPPRWSLPLAVVGATLGALVVLRFVWDQAI